MARKVRRKNAPSEQSQAEAALAKIAKDAIDCRDCDLWQRATQTVFGEGDTSARE